MFAYVFWKALSLKQNHGPVRFCLQNQGGFPGVLGGGGSFHRSSVFVAPLRTCSGPRTTAGHDAFRARWEGLLWKCPLVVSLYSAFRARVRSVQHVARLSLLKKKIKCKKKRKKEMFCLVRAAPGPSFWLCLVKARRDWNSPIKINLKWILAPSEGPDRTCVCARAAASLFGPGLHFSPGAGRVWTQVWTFIKHEGLERHGSARDWVWARTAPPTQDGSLYIKKCVTQASKQLKYIKEFGFKLKHQ